MTASVETQHSNSNSLFATCVGGCFGGGARKTCFPITISSPASCRSSLAPKSPSAAVVLWGVAGAMSSCRLS
eukprot:7405231-Pyramimonas_sp.AAC.1